MAEIQRLRRKFILVGTLAVIIIVVGALGLINTISYMRMQHSVFFAPHKYLRKWRAAAAAGRRTALFLD